VNSARRMRTSLRRWRPSKASGLALFDSKEPKAKKKWWRRFYGAMTRRNKRFLGWHARWMWEGRELFMTDDAYETFLYGKTWGDMTVDERHSRLRMDALRRDR